MYKSMMQNIYICIYDAENYQKEASENPILDLIVIPNKENSGKSIHVDIYFLNRSGQMYPKGRKKKFYFMPNYAPSITRLQAIRSGD